MTQPIPFGKYYLLDRINVGGMAEVFKAKAVGVEGFERMVAVKRILPNIAEDQEFITMFIDEAKIAVQLTHANIAQIFDLGRVDESYFIALEYVHGKDMRALFNRARTRGGAVPVPLACYAIMKVCEGLDYAHNKRDAGGQFLNLVHRDVSPQNVLVSYEGEVKIIDFGIAKAAGKAGTTQAGILKGKFGYMSPEQANGAEIDRRSDLFAVGICLYELLTGQRAFLGDNDLATLENVRNVRLTPPRQHEPSIPEAVERIVLKALSAELDQRHQTAQQLQQELAAFLRSLPGPACDRRELSAYMRGQFAQELAAETDREADEPAIPAAPAQPSEDGSGLSVFDHIAPQETSFSLHEETPPRSGRLSHKITLQGLPGMLDDVPGLSRSSASVRPRPLSVPPAPAASFAQAAPQRVGSERVGTEIEWDEEELSTQIYDPPEERVPEALVDSGAALRNSWPPNPPVISARTLSGRPPFHLAPPAGSTPSWGGVGGATQTRLASRALPPSRSPLLLVGSVAALVLSVAGFLWFFHAPSSGVVELQTLPKEVSVTLDGRPVGGTSPFTIRGVTVGSPHTISVHKPGYRAWSKQVELRQGETLRLQPLSLAAIESGFALDSVPSGASVFVNGVRLEDTTPVRVSALGPGEHRIRVEAQGYAPAESTVLVTPGTVLDLPVAQLIARSAEPQHATRRNATDAALSAGQPASERARTSDVPAKRVATASPAMVTKPAAGSGKPVEGGAELPGTLRIQTKPWSQVSVDGQPAGTTPLMNVPVKPGKHTLTFVNEEFGVRKTVTVQVEPGKVSTQVLDLTR